MAATTMDPEFARHYRTWMSFGRLMRWTAALVIIILILLAIFLL